MSVLKLEHVKKDFTLRNGLKTTTIHAVKDASFELASDKTIALVGESGSGKSTIARMITCLETRLLEASRWTASLSLRMVRICTNTVIMCKWYFRIRSLP